jgi:hypothetical protein
LTPDGDPHGLTSECFFKSNKYFFVVKLVVLTAFTLLFNLRNTVICRLSRLHSVSCNGYCKHTDLDQTVNGVIPSQWHGRRGGILYYLQTTFPFRNNK